MIRKIAIAAARRNSEYVCIANVHSLIEASNDAAFAKVLNNAGIVTPDGMPITWAMRLLYGFKQERIPGMTVLPDSIQAASDAGLPVFFYGATEEILSKTDAFIKNYFPALNVAGMYSPPFRKLTQHEEEVVVSIINASGAAVVFVALGCPKQEKWMASMKGRINATMIGVGGALPVMIGLQKRAPAWMQNIGLEWLFRLCQEPGRLFKRYAITNTRFVVLLCKEFIRRKHIKAVEPNYTRRFYNKV